MYMSNSDYKFNFTYQFNDIEYIIPRPTMNNYQNKSNTCVHDFENITCDFGETITLKCKKCGFFKTEHLFVRDKDYDSIEPYNL